MSHRIVNIGDLTADLVMPVKMPIQAGQSQQMPFYSVEPGGAGNFLIVGQRLGAQMSALGALGNDLYGRYIRDVLQGEGVDMQAVILADTTPTTVVAVIFEPDAGKFSYVWHGGYGAPLPVDETARRIIDQGDVLFMQGFTLCEESLQPLVKYSFASGKRIWYDVGPATRDVPHEMRVRIRERAYGLMTTADELPLIADDLVGDAAYDLLLRAGAKVLVIKQGSKGCSVITPDHRFDVPAFPVKARDLIGAGDSFNAAFLYGVLRGLTLEQAALLANATGAAKVQKLGTGRAMPTKAEVAAVLTNAGHHFEF